jgi:glycosyltransferase involved in cell wall biosynthesis
MKKDIFNLINDLNINDFVIVIDELDQELLATIIPHAFSYLSPHCGRALLEVALAEIPIIAYNLDWQNEIIINNYTGVLLNVLDYREMGKALIIFFNNTKFAKELSINARIKALELSDNNLFNSFEIESYLKLFYKL